MFLTIGMATYDDFDGVYFTLQALKAYHDLTDVELVVVDTKPKSCEDTKNACAHVGAKYVHAPDKPGTSQSRNHVFEIATGKFVMCIDCHIMFQKDSIKKLKDYLKANENTKDMIQGPLLYDNQRDISTHFNPEWRGHMYGTWATDPKVKDNEPFDIPMQGCGVFCMRKDAWPTFNKDFKGFGGEEGYIQEKVRQNGGRSLCLPFLKWVHRFSRPKGVPYPLALTDRIFNYIIGWTELGLNHREVIAYCTPQVKQEELFKSISESSKIIGNPTPLVAVEKNDFKLKAYVIGTQNNETEKVFSNIKWEKEKEYFPDLGIKGVLEKFVDEDYDYALLCKQDFKIEKTLNKLIEFWPLVKTKQAKIVLFEQTTKGSLKSIHSQLSYRITEKENIDNASCWLISKDFAEIVLKTYQQNNPFSEVCKQEKIDPMIYIFDEALLRLKLQYVPLYNVSGDLSLEATREIVWEAKNSWCLEISEYGMQTSIALCQKGFGVVKVSNSTEEEKIAQKEYVKKFNYDNLLMTNKEDDFKAPDEGKRVLLINHKKLSEELKDFALLKIEDFLRTGDSLIVTHSDGEIRNTYKNLKNFKPLKISDDYLILTRL